MTSENKENIISNIEDYIALHQDGVPLYKVTPVNNQTFEVFRSSNVDIRIIDREACSNLTYKLQHIAGFTKDPVSDLSYRFFYSIPLQTVSGNIAGFIYRTVYGKNYTSVLKDFGEKHLKVPIMFGWYKDFADFNCNPIVVCEGIKDCITLKKIYPYVLSNNTNRMGMNLQVLSNLTNKFILIYDNDRAGREGVLSDITEAQKKRLNVLEMKLNFGYKDITDCSEDEAYFSRLRTQLLQAIRSLEDENSLNYCVGRSEWSYR